MTILNLGFLASGNGSNMQAIIDACKSGELNANLKVLISNNLNSYAIQRAMNENMPYYHISEKTCGGLVKVDQVIIDTLKKHNVNTVLLVGYLKKLGPKVLYEFKGRVLNIHPSLLPKFGGEGMYGKKVHQAVLDAGEEVTGATIHLVNEKYDEGLILNNSLVPVQENDDVESLSKRVLESEHKLFVETLRLISEGKIKLG